MRLGAALTRLAGLLLYTGVGGAPRDERASAQWHAAAAAQGNVDGLATLGGCIRRGVGAEQNEAVGVRLIEAAASAGSAVGLTKLGALHDEGASGYQADSWRAAQCYERVAEQGSALGLFNHGWALVHGIGTARDVERGLEAWWAAMALAPDDGAEEAAFFLYDERSCMSDEQVARYRPGKCLRLSAALGYDKAVKELRRREQKRQLTDLLGGKDRGERFIRNDKARAWTAKEERGEQYL